MTRQGVTGGAIWLSEGWRRAQRSVRVQMALLTVALVLTTGLAAALLIVDSYRAHSRSTELQLTETASALSLAVDGKVSESAGVLKTLALSRALAAGDLADFEREARQAVGGPDRWVVLFDDQGRWLVDTALPPGAPLPRKPPALFHASRQAPGQGFYVSDLLPNSVTGGSMVAVAMPVPRPGGSSWRLAVGLSPSVSQEVVAEQGLPPGWFGALHDRQGRIIARSPDNARYVGRLGPPSVLEHILHNTKGVIQGRSLEGVPILTAYKRSPLTGWTLMVAMPKNVAQAALVRSLALTVALVLGLLTLGVGLVWRLGGRIGRAIDGLAQTAQALGRGTLPMTPPAATGLRDIDAVGSALHEASVRLKQREDELRRLNETLERRVAERTRELAAATERLAQARKMEAIGRLTGGVAHDFNNLLAVIVGNLDLLGKRLSDEKLSRYVAHARIAADRGAELTRQLLAFGRRQRMHPQPLELNELIESAAVLLCSALGPTVTVRARPGPEPVWVCADREQLEMVIMNLAMNAKDAMPEGGEVTLGTGRAMVGAPGGGPEAPPPGDFGVLSVCDTGVGMTPEVLAQIWEPFFSTKKHGAGSGLGLAQVLGAVQQLGGGVSVQTEPGRGACVQVHLPHAAEPVAAPARPAPAEAAAATPTEAWDGLLIGRKIMLVDDDAGVRGVTADLLRDLGCETEELASGADALARLDAGARPDVLVTDYAMPGMTGAEVARLSEQRRPDLPVLLISGYLDAEALERTWNGPVLAKPFSKTALAARLTQALLPGAGAARTVQA